MKLYLVSEHDYYHVVLEHSSKEYQHLAVSATVPGIEKKLAERGISLNACNAANADVANFVFQKIGFKHGWQNMAYEPMQLTDELAAALSAPCKLQVKNNAKGCPFDEESTKAVNDWHVKKLNDEDFEVVYEKPSGTKKVQVTEQNNNNTEQWFDVLPTFHPLRPNRFSIL